MENINKKEYEKSKKFVIAYDNKLREEIDKELAEDNKKYVGKCYKFRNSCGSGDSWWLYIKVIGTDDTWLITEDYQKTCYNDIEIKQHKHSVYSIGRQMEGYTPITNKEFEEVKKKVLTELKA